MCELELTTSSGNPLNMSACCSLCALFMLATLPLVSTVCSVACSHLSVFCVLLPQRQRASNRPAVEVKWREQRQQCMLARGAGLQTRRVRINSLEGRERESTAVIVSAENKYFSFMNGRCNSKTRFGGEDAAEAWMSSYCRVPEW